MSNEQEMSLVETDKCRVTYILSSKRFTITFRSCQASFNSCELEYFHLLLSTLKPRDFCYEFSGEPAAMIKSPSAPVGFFLFKKEAAQLAEAVAESLALFDAYSVVYNI